jgi:hypothetical protein
MSATDRRCQRLKLRLEFKFMELYVEAIERTFGSNFVSGLQHPVECLVSGFLHDSFSTLGFLEQDIFRSVLESYSSLDMSIFTGTIS